jgi:hypothetical protein
MYDVFLFYFQNIDLDFLLQIVSKLTPLVMADIDRILGNKPCTNVSIKNETLNNDK